MVAYSTAQSKLLYRTNPTVCAIYIYNIYIVFVFLITHHITHSTVKLIVTSNTHQLINHLQTTNSYDNVYGSLNNTENRKDVYY